MSYRMFCLYISIHHIAWIALDRGRWLHVPVLSELLANSPVPADRCRSGTFEFSFMIRASRFCRSML
jgi:hypothetical protein